jgi:hypothetical protein
MDGTSFRTGTMNNTARSGSTRELVAFVVCSGCVEELIRSFYLPDPSLAGLPSGSKTSWQINVVDKVLCFQAARSIKPFAALEQLQLMLFSKAQVACYFLICCSSDVVVTKYRLAYSRIINRLNSSNVEQLVLWATSQGVQN